MNNLNNIEYLKQFSTLRNLFPNETSDFTPYLVNTNIIQKIINSLCIPEYGNGVSLSLWRREVQVGSSRIDAIYHDKSNPKIPPIIIENQYGLTDNKHLGQIIVYAKKTKIKNVLWIAENITPEHLGITSVLKDINIYLATISISNDSIYITTYKKDGRFNKTIKIPKDPIIKKKENSSN